MSAFKHFDPDTDERLFVCSETGETGIPYRFVHRLDQLRGRCGFPFIITSGYRSPRHSIEAAKDEPGEHTRGAADVGVEGGAQRRKIVAEAIGMGFTGIGVARTFVHVDDRLGDPVMWVY